MNVPGDLPVAETLGRGEHALEEVLGRAFRILRHPPAGVGDEPGDRLLQRFQRPVERAIGRQPEPAPVRDRGARSPRDHVERPVQVTDQLGVAALERVDVLPEGQRRRDVDGVRLERTVDVHRGTVAGDALQAPVQSPRGDGDHVVAAVQVIGVQCRHREPALALPVLTLGGEHAVGTHVLHHAGHLGVAPEAIGTPAQDRVDRVTVGDDDHRICTDVDAEHRAVPTGHLLEEQVQPRRAQLVGVAQARQPSGAWEVLQADGGGRTAHRSPSCVIRMP